MSLTRIPTGSEVRVEAWRSGEQASRQFLSGKKSRGRPERLHEAVVDARDVPKLVDCIRRSNASPNLHITARGMSHCNAPAKLMYDRKLGFEAASDSAPLPAPRRIIVPPLPAPRRIFVPPAPMNGTPYAANSVANTAAAFQMWRARATSRRPSKACARQPPGFSGPQNLFPQHDAAMEGCTAIGCTTISAPEEVKEEPRVVELTPAVRTTLGRIAALRAAHRIVHEKEKKLNRGTMPGYGLAAPPALFWGPGVVAAGRREVAMRGAAPPAPAVCGDETVAVEDVAVASEDEAVSADEAVAIIECLEATMPIAEAAAVEEAGAELEEWVLADEPNV